MTKNTRASSAGLSRHNPRINLATVSRLDAVRSVSLLIADLWIEGSVRHVNQQVGEEDDRSDNEDARLDEE